ncbi:carboxyl-terminal processing protease [Fontibacillus panacisegetis]|uniref:Carboxyl-terminal processing protease n=1 Tax=Fontibacillus panacisegetis TaxID=670482 RepID=A0A1G7IQF8_9BACL|nr:S41 family peptidase [Fontibacillus panacisegetis]SDF14845.1 carboxyl-terminal processing protease [Fontibacillus panacisegetis]
MNLYKLRQKALIPLLAISIFALPAAAGAAEATNVAESSDMAILQEVLDYLEAYNIEGAERELLLENAIRGMVYTLDDPYSDYYSKEELQQFEDSINQEYVGIGVTLRFNNNNLYITEVLAGSPASKSGLKQNDIIKKVDGQAVKSIDDIMLISGEEDSKVAITILRGDKTLAIPVTRTHFTLPSVKGSMIPSTRIGYIAITSFSDTADQEFDSELDKLRKAGMKSIVLDLRDNLGGYVEVAQNIAKRFIKNGTLMYTADQSGVLEEIPITDGENIGMPVVVLTNELTASASEILTGALHDNGVATVIGSQTYGKARIQNLFTLSNGSSLKLTVQRYLTPNKLDFNHTGLTPDIEVSNSSVAQLITGLYKAGLRTIDIQATASSFSVNGASFGGEFIDIIQSGNKVYVSSRVLGSLVKGSVTWDNINQKLIITDSSGKKSGFSIAAKSAKMVDSQSYIELHDFQKKFTDVKWSYQQGVLKLSK